LRRAGLAGRRNVPCRPENVHAQRRSFSGPAERLIPRYPMYAPNKRTTIPGMLQISRVNQATTLAAYHQMKMYSKYEMIRSTDERNRIIATAPKLREHKT
jgi:hypothetical protein